MVTRRWLIDPKHSCRRLFTRSGPFATQADRLRQRLEGGRLPVAGPAARRAIEKVKGLGAPRATPGPSGPARPRPVCTRSRAWRCGYGSPGREVKLPLFWAISRESRQSLSSSPAGGVASVGALRERPKVSSYVLPGSNKEGKPLMGLKLTGPKLPPKPLTGPKLLRKRPLN